jgi:NADPH-ferrihemoprotein reductase
MLEKEKANFYVCGDASNMAREVSIILSKIISEQRGLSAEKGEEIVKNMRSSNQYQEDVWS